MEPTAGNLPQLFIVQISSNFVLKRPVRPWHEGRSVQHGVLFEKGLDSLAMPIGMEKQATEVLLLITPILAIGFHISSLSDHKSESASTDGRNMIESIVGEPISVEHWLRVCALTVCTK